MSDQTTDPAPAQERHPGMPRWVKIIALGGAVLVLAAVGLALAGGDHGPGRHLGGDDPAPGHTAPPGGGGHTPPPSAHE